MLQPGRALNSSFWVAVKNGVAWGNISQLYLDARVNISQLYLDAWVNISQLYLDVCNLFVDTWIKNI